MLSSAPPSRYFSHAMLDLELTIPAQRRRRQRPHARRAPQGDVLKLPIPHRILLGYRLWQTHHLWHRNIEKLLATLDLTHLHYALLSAMNYMICHGEIPSQIRLSQFTKVEKMMISKNLRVLERRGLVSRKPDPEDRRANRLLLTEAGIRTLQRGFAASRKAHASFFFRVLGAEERRLNEMLQALMDSQDRAQPGNRSNRLPRKTHKR